jgi:flagellar hook-associated protein 3 FlgL
VTAETVFADASGTIFDALEAAGKALRGTADPAADRATVLAQLDRLSAFAEEASVARAQIGASLERVETITERLDQTFLAQASTLQRIESADFVESAIQLTESERALSAVLQTAARLARRSLIDLLG